MHFSPPFFEIGTLWNQPTQSYLITSFKGISDTPAPALPPWCSRAPGCPALRTPATIITHTCFPRHAHQRFIGLTWTQSPVLLPLSVCSLLLHSLLFVFVLPGSDAAPVLFHLCAEWNVHSPYLFLYSSIGSYRYHAINITFKQTHLFQHLTSLQG